MKKAVLTTLALLAISMLFYILYLSLNPSQHSSAVRFDNQPSYGSPKAPVTLIEFGDFQCPGCRFFSQAILLRLDEEYIQKGKLRFVFLNLSFLGTDSVRAALVARSIYHMDSTKNKQLFWRYYHGLYANQGPEKSGWFTDQFLGQFLTVCLPEVNLDRIMQELSDQKYIEEVNQLARLGKESGVDTAPVLFVNNKRIHTFTDYDKIKASIERELNQSE